MNTSSDQNKILQHLQSASSLTAVVATVDSAFIPHGATVYYLMDDLFHFYFLTATHTHTYTNLSTNPQAAIVIGFGPDQTTIQGQGTARLLQKNSESEKEIVAQLKKRLQKEDVSWPIFKLTEFEREAIAVFKCTPESLQLLNLETDTDIPTTPSQALDIL